MVRVTENEGIQMGSESGNRKYGVMEGQGEGKAIDLRDNKHPRWLFPLHSQIPPPRTLFKCWFMGAIYCHWKIALASRDGLTVTQVSCVPLCLYHSGHQHFQFRGEGMTNDPAVFWGRLTRLKGH